MRPVVRVTSTYMEAAVRRPATRALEPAPLSEPGERIRFVLRAQLRAAGVNQSKLAAEIARANSGRVDDRRMNGKDVRRMGKSGLSYWLTTGDLTSDDLAFVRLVERHGVHNSATSRYAQRILDSVELDRRGDSQWWIDAFSKMPEYNTPIEVIVAGLSLYQYVIERGSTSPRNDDELSPAAVRRLAFALCRVGSGSMGYAGEALTTIARLGAVVSEHVAEFISLSPLGLWLGRAADGALRREPTGRTAGDSRKLTADYTQAAVALQQQITPDIPAACTGHLRLLRRVALDYENEKSVSTSLALLNIARDTNLSPRWRRFALWASCEPAIRQPALLRSEFEACMINLRHDPVVEDVIDQLVGKDADRPDYRLWGGDMPSQFDAFLKDTRGGDPDVFTWPLRSYPATDAVLTKYTLRNYAESEQAHLIRVENLGDVGHDIRLRLLDALHEAIVHPGIIRIQSAIDMFQAAGPCVANAVVQTISLILQDGEVLNNPTSHHPALIESCLEILGGMRQPTALPVLVRAATPEYGQFVHARAIWAIGDVLSNHRDKQLLNLEIMQVLNNGLIENSLSVRRSTIHTIAVAKLEMFAEKINTLTSDAHDERDWARWCAKSWIDKDFINSTPSLI